MQPQNCVNGPDVKYGKGLFIAALLVLLILANLAPEGHGKTDFSVGGGNQPVFKVTGNMVMTNLIIYGHRIRLNDGSETCVVWKLAAKGDSLWSLYTLDEIGSIIYGIVPKGYKQIYPKKDIRLFGVFLKKSNG